MNYIDGYFSALKSSLDALDPGSIDRVVQVLFAARMKRRKIFIMGNGGSASTASHFVCDLAKNTRLEFLPDFRVIGLADNMAIFSAYANDEGYENVFSNQLKSQVQPGDVIIGISTSGNSKNVLKAIEIGKSNDAFTIGFTGFDGGQLGSIVDLHMHVPSDRIEQVEDIQLILEHLITRALRTKADDFPISALEIDRGQTLRQALWAEPIELLGRFARDLGERMDLSTLLRSTLRMTIETVEARSGSIVLLDHRGHVVEGVVEYGGEVWEYDEQKMGDTLENGLAGWVYQNREPALIDRTTEDPRWLRRSWEENGGLPRSAMSVPLRVDDQIVGVLTLVRSETGSFTQAHLGLLIAIASYVSLSGHEFLKMTSHEDDVAADMTPRPDAEPDAFSASD